MKLYSISPFLLQTAVWIPTQLILLFCGRLEVRGLENLTRVRQGVLFVVNHTSELDAILIPACLPFFSRLSPIFYTSRERTFYATSGWRQRFYGGMFFKMWGAYPVKTGMRNYESSLATHISLLQDKMSICIFPEGKKSLDGEIKDAKGGVAYLCWRTKSTIVPVHILGVFKISFADFLLRRRRIKVSFGVPLRSEDLFAREPLLSETRDDFKTAADMVMQSLRTLT